MQPQTLRGPHRGRAIAPAARRGAGPSSVAARRVAATAAATARPKHSLAHYDVLGVGQALVDMQFTVDNDAVLDALGVAKGGRRVVTPAERAELLRVLSSSSASSSSSSSSSDTDAAADATLTPSNPSLGGGGGARVSAGGSLANTLVGLSRLGRASGRPLSVALGGSAGGADGLGSLARRELRRAGVDTVSGGDSSSSSSDSDGANSSQQETGTVIVVTSRRDAQRSFLACFPPDQSLERDNAQAAAAAAAATTTTTTTPLRQAAQSASLLALEGYMLELPGAAEALPALARLARASGARVALAAGDAGVVRRHRAAVRAVLKAGVDLVLANAEEAEELAAIVGEGAGAQADAASTGAATPTLATPTKSPPAEAAARSLARGLGAGALVSVTDGSRGAYLASGGELAVVPPCWSREAPVDTTGAGDAYAAGLLFELLAQLKERDGSGDESASAPSALDLHAMGASARRAAAAVIARVGPALTEEDAARVVAAGRGFGGGADAPSPLVLQTRPRFVGSPARR